jgi:hypothetical protein
MPSPSVVLIPTIRRTFKLTTLMRTAVYKGLHSMFGLGAVAFLKVCQPVAYGLAVF